MTDKQILKWLDQLQGELDALKKKAGGGGGGGGAVIEKIYESSGVSSGIVTLDKAWHEYDLIQFNVMYTGSAGYAECTRLIVTDSFLRTNAITSEAWYLHVSPVTDNDKGILLSQAHEAALIAVYGVKL